MVIELGGYQFDISYRALVVGCLDYSADPDFPGVSALKEFLIWQRKCLRQAEDYVDEGADILEFSLGAVQLSDDDRDALNNFLRSVGNKFALPVFLATDIPIPASVLSQLEVEVVYERPLQNSLLDIYDLDCKGALSEYFAEKVFLSSSDLEASTAEMVALQTKHIVNNGRIIRTHRVRLSRRVADLTSAILQAQK